MEVPDSIQGLINTSAAFAMVCVALFVVYKRMTKSEAENKALLEEKANIKPVLEDVKKVMAEVVHIETTRETNLQNNIQKIIDKLDKILLK